MMRSFRHLVLILAVACSAGSPDREAGRSSEIPHTDVPSVPATDVEGPAGGLVRVDVVAAGDIATSGPGALETARLVTALDPRVVLTLGDNAYPDGTLSNFRSYYEPTWGRFKAITKPAPGNHDWHAPDAAGYTSYFGKAFPVASVVAHVDLVPGWDIYQLDTEADLPEQIAELETLLANNDDACEIVYGHHPRWSSGTHGDDPSKQALWSVLVRAGVELYLAGHDHTYERFAQMDTDGKAIANGTRQIVAGLGGASAYPFGGTDGASEKRLTGSENWGVLVLDLRRGSYAGGYRRATGGSGTVADSFSAACH